MLLSSLPAVYSRWLFASAPLPALFSRWLFAIVPLPADTQQRRPGWSAPPQRLSRPASPLQHLGQHLRCSALAGQLLRRSAPASQQLRRSARTSSSASAPQPASNKPHSAEKSTPVWLAIWHIWAGFANSQLLRATFQSIYLYTCAHPHCCYLGSAAQTDANLSAHLHRLPTPPPYLRRVRLSPGRGAGVGWQMMLLVVRIAVPANHRARESLF